MYVCLYVYIMLIYVYKYISLSCMYIGIQVCAVCVGVRPIIRQCDSATVRQSDSPTNAIFL